MSDDVIGSIEGTATFQKVKVRQYDGDRIEVAGKYHGDETTYSAPPDSVFIGGMNVSQLSDKLVLEPRDDDYLWVEATEDELRITKDKPNDD